MTHFIYVIHDSGRKASKIGHAAKPHQRLKDIQCGNAQSLDLYYIFAVDAFRGERLELTARRVAHDIERAAHRRLHKHRLMGEWFAVTPATAAEVICDLAVAATVPIRTEYDWPVDRRVVRTLKRFAERHAYSHPSIGLE